MHFHSSIIPRTAETTIQKYISDFFCYSLFLANGNFSSRFGIVLAFGMVAAVEVYVWILHG